MASWPRGHNNGKSSASNGESRCLAASIQAMTAVPESRCLFMRGPQSVRVVREHDSTRWRLTMFGPGTAVEICEFADLPECMKRQTEVEQQLLAEGYQVAQVPSDRRREYDTWHGDDQRRTAS
jgi:hypothetical protein